MIDRIVPYLQSWRAIVGSLPAKVGPLLPVAVAIFGCSLPLAVAIFLVIWHFHLRKIAIFVQVVEFVRASHR